MSIIIAKHSSPMSANAQHSQKHDDNRLAPREGAVRLLAVIGMPITFFASVVGLEYLVSDDPNLGRSVQSTTQDFWPWMRAAGLWAFGGVMFLAGFIYLLIKQMPSEH